MAIRDFQGYNPMADLNVMLGNLGTGSAVSGIDSTDFLSGLKQTPGLDNSVSSMFGDWFKNSGFLGSTSADGVKTQGWGGTALGVAQGIGNAYLGMQQYGLAKDQLAASKDQFAKNYAAQSKTTNAALSDRQTARVASNPSAYQSVGDYMKQYGI